LNSLASSRDGESGGLELLLGVFAEHLFADFLGGLGAVFDVEGANQGAEWKVLSAELEIFNR
jgi:hypothetical protein